MGQFDNLMFCPCCHFPMPVHPDWGKTYRVKGETKDRYVVERDWKGLSRGNAVKEWNKLTLEQKKGNKYFACIHGCGAVLVRDKDKWAMIGKREINKK